MRTKIIIFTSAVFLSGIIFSPSITFANNIEVLKSWIEGDCHYVTVKYRNNSDQTYKSVTVSCTAIDRDGNPISTDSDGFYEYKDDHIKPEFERDVTIRLELYGKSMFAVHCQHFTKP